MATSQLLKNKKCTELWEQSVEHPFIRQLVKGSLPHDKFRDYIIQDKIFCESFRCFVCQVLADCPHAEDFEVFHKLVAELQGYGHEAQLFEEIFQMLNITNADMRAHPTTEAFSNFLWKIGTTATLEEKLVVLYAIEGSYMEWADRAKKSTSNAKSENDIYGKWIEIHSGQNLGKLVDWIKKSLDDLLGQKMTDDHHQLFQRSLQYEIMFWDTAFMPGSSVFSGEFGITHPLGGHQKGRSGLRM